MRMGNLALSVVFFLLIIQMLEALGCREGPPGGKEGAITAKEGATKAKMESPGDKDKAPDKSRQILETHKAEFHECFLEYEELLRLALADLPGDPVRRRLAMKEMQQKRKAFEQRRCLDRVLATVRGEAAVAGIDEKVFEETFKETYEGWKAEW